MTRPSWSSIFPERLADRSNGRSEAAVGADLIDASALSGIQLLAWGGYGEDTIIGGAHSDGLTGGGKDRFVLGRENTNGIAERDTVTDYAKGDIIDLRGAAGGFAAEATEEGLMLTFAEGDQDQVMLQGITSLAAVDIWI